MTKYIIRRFVFAVPVVLGVATLVFFMLHLIPGDPISAIFAQQSMTEAQIQTIRDRLGLNDPLMVQYAKFIGRAVQGDLGRSIQGGRTVTDLILRAVPLHPATGPAGHAHGDDPGLVAGHPGRDQLQLLAGQRRHGAVRGWGVYPRLLDRADDDLLLLGATQDTSLLGRGQLAAPDHARHRHRHRRDGRHRPHDPLQSGGGTAAGLCPHGPGQGSAGAG